MPAEGWVGGYRGMATRPASPSVGWKGEWMAKKSRTTFNKVARDRELRERRELKREKKQAAKMAKPLGLETPAPLDSQPI